VAIVVLAAVIALLGLVLALVWMRARAAEANAILAMQRMQSEADEERGRLEAEVLRLRRMADTHRELLGRLQRAWRSEREWSRELRGQIGRLGHDRGDGDGDGGGEDVRDLVLRAAMQLAESDRGLLLSRNDEDDDGDLDVVVTRGFEHDPRHSAIAQRFAREVLERDTIVREDRPGATTPERTNADEEIDSLVAIPLYLRDRFNGVVVCANRPGGFDDVDDEVLLALGDHASAALQHGLLRHQLDEAHRAAVRVLIEAVAAGEPMLHRESTRLLVFALHLARDLDLDRRDRDVLVCALLLRGVGHLPLPEAVLEKPQPLTPGDRALVEMHPRIAFNVVGQAPELRDVATALLYHQERFDGTGYPAGLAGDDIPLLSRALAVIEAFGAMTHSRTYRPPRSVEEACQELVAAAGSQFDPEIVELMVAEVRRSGADPSDALVESVLEALPFNFPASAAGTLGPLGASSTDGLTLLGDHRALQQAVREAVRYAHDGRPFAIALMQLDDLSRLNEESSFVVGDRAIQLAGRNAKRAAVRLGGTAYRASGRRLAIIAPLRGDVTTERLRDEIAMEFAGGPAISQAIVDWQSDERAEALVARARRALQQAGTTRQDTR
jgi:GGDEF domain-containing protein